jgi:hypothetical protein
MYEGKDKIHLYVDVNSCHNIILSPLKLFYVKIYIFFFEIFLKKFHKFKIQKYFQVINRWTFKLQTSQNTIWTLILGYYWKNRLNKDLIEAKISLKVNSTKIGRIY